MEEISREEEFKDKSPLSILDEIKAYPSPKGSYPTIIAGRPIDLHVLEDYMLKISPYSLKTILRYNNARMIEEIKNYSRLGQGTKMGSRIWILLLLGIGMAVLGIILIFYLPDIMKFFSGGAGIT